MWTIRRKSRTVPLVATVICAIWILSGLVYGCPNINTSTETGCFQSSAKLPVHITAAHTCCGNEAHCGCGLEQSYPSNVTQSALLPSSGLEERVTGDPTLSMGALLPVVTGREVSRGTMPVARGLSVKIYIQIVNLIC